MSDLTLGDEIGKLVAYVYFTGGRWCVRSWVGTKFVRQSMSRSRHLILKNEKRMRLVFEDDNAIAEFLADNHPDLADFRQYVDLHRNFIHQAGAITLDEMIEQFKWLLPTLVPPAAGTVNRFDTLLAIPFTHFENTDTKPSLFLQAGSAAWSFQRVTRGDEADLFRYLMVLEKEDLLAEIVRGRLAPDCEPVTMFNTQGTLRCSDAKQMGEANTILFRLENRWELARVFPNIRSISVPSLRFSNVCEIEVYPVIGVETWSGFYQEVTDPVPVVRSPPFDVQVAA